MESSPSKVKFLFCVQHTSQRQRGDCPGLLERSVHREIDDHAECNSRCESCDNPQPSRQLYSEFCMFNHVSVKFKEADEYVTVLGGEGPRCEHFCGVVPRKGQRLAQLDVFLAFERARYPSMQVN